MTVEYSAKARRYAEGDRMEHTPAAAVTAGVPTQVADGLVGIPDVDVAAAAEGSFATRGQYAIAATSAVGNKGDNLYWDANGSPYGGTASSGAATTIASAGDFWIGILAKAKGATDSEAIFNLNMVNPNLPHWPGRIHETKADNYTIDDLDSGKVLHIATDTKTFTLPADMSGIDVILQNDGADAAVAVSVTPAANDELQGMDIDGTAATALLNTKTTAIRGDFIHLHGGTATYTMIIDKRGIWAE